MGKIKKIIGRYYKELLVLVVFLSLAVFSVVSVTLAYFAQEDNADRSIPFSGAVSISIIGSGQSATIGDDEMEMTLANGNNYLIPGMPVGLRCNCVVNTSTTSPLVRALIMVDLYNVSVDREDIRTDIESAIEAVIGSTWTKYNGYYYYINNNALQSTVQNTVMQDVDVSLGDTQINFVNTDFTFPSTVTEIQSGAIVKVRIKFEAIQDYIPNASGNKLTNTIANAIPIFEESTAYNDTLNYVYVESDGKVLISARNADILPTDIIIPSTINGLTVDGIADNGFKNITTLTSISFESGFSGTTIGEEAFKGCTSLTNITFCSSITTIGVSAFNSCTSLTNIIIPNNIIYIKGYAFSGCSSLVNVYVERDIVSDSAITNGVNNMFDTTALKHIYVPSTSLTQYKDASGWSTYLAYIVAIS